MRILQGFEAYTVEVLCHRFLFVYLISNGLAHRTNYICVIYIIL